MFATLLVIVLAGPLVAIGPRPLVPTVVGEIGTRRLAATLSAEAAPVAAPGPAPVAPASGGSAGLR